MSADTTFDLEEIARAHKAVACSVLKRTRLLREARAALQAGRAALASARQASETAHEAAAAARHVHSQAVAACSRPGTAGFTGGHSVQALVGYCEASARTLDHRRAQARQAAVDLADHQRRVDELTQNVRRAEYRLDQVNEEDAAWVRRKALAIEVLSDLALEDEPSHSTTAARAGAA
jgi:hypothetical protein